MADNDDYGFYNDFKEMGLKDNLLRGIYGYGFEHPSEIQSKAIVPILKGRDIIGQAKSGTGKTATFGIGILNLIDYEMNNIQGLILVHTRELAIQIYNVIKSLGNYLKIKINISIGGIKSENDLNESHIIVGTVGRLNDLIVRKRIINLNELKIFVIDEADAVLINKKDNLQQVKEIVMNIPKESQICLFSATMPESVIELSRKFMNKPVKILVEDEKLTLEGIHQYYIDLGNEKYKLDTLKDIYNRLNISQCIIYINTKEKGEFLYNKLTDENFMVSLIHGGMEQNKRYEVMDKFRKGDNRILLSTDLLARGIDVQQVNLIINYDLPYESECYLHRIGRSGRFGRKGVVINFIVNDDKKIFKEIIKLYNINMNELTDNVLNEL